ncbi:MAG: substrate-binding domain-containing protein [Gammaproteobacteria bacterium]|nr:substrate-binding domain-containing protein [Gammaproteobacteria bacterium]
MFEKIRTAVVAAMLVSASFAAVTQAKAGDDPLIIMVSGPLIDPFFSSLKKGVDDASDAMGVDTQFSTITSFDNVQADLVRLLDIAVSRNPDALLVGNFFPDAMGPLVKRASENGIPVFIHNTGASTWRELGAVGYVGEAPYQMGKTAGEFFLAQGANNGICFIHVPGQPALEQRCAGFEDTMKGAGGTSKMLSIPATDSQNSQAILQALKGAIQTNPDLSAIFTLGATQAALAVQAVKEQDKIGKIRVGTTDLSTPMLEAVKAGELEFLIDQQPYLQGYYSVTAAVHFLRYGLAPVDRIQTGPLLITAENADQVLEANRKYTGVRGAQ